MAEVWRKNLHKFLSFHEIFDQESRTDVNAVLDQLNAVEYVENYTSDQAVCCIIFGLA